jgi:CRP/FNR family transcriptional regulator, polysaccharide utilization system transcription regulator
MKNQIEKIRCAQCLSRDKSMFNHLSNEEVAEIDKVKTCQMFKKGEIIFQEGGIPHGVYCIKYGKIKLYKTGSEGKDQIIKFAKDGDLIGYRSLLCNEKLNATAACLDETVACFIPKDHVLKILTENAGLAMNVMQKACQELGEASKIITNLAQKTIIERTAEVLLILQSNFGLDSNQTIQVILSREDIANMVGTATETLIRTLSKFSHDGLIELTGKSIRLLNTHELSKIAKLED